ncbi:iron complex transport system substrate-binding protein [Succiniclasticum ruminis DSM 9236]|uniref:Iron complex transport system substrate-binding protein n=2 Tax=Succiniclasticum ruminis TaxID=40841 RepID=A0A1I1XQC7_9FIRM|nr:iron complex transport system substrate-binding protein [Succiniclasticum ruminis DSM 9236]
MCVKRILTLFLFSFFLISALLSGCSPSPQSQSSSKTNAAQSKQETNTTGSYSVTDLTGTKVTFPSKPKRILTFAMYTDQIVLGLVTSNHLVGINTLMDDPVLSNVVPIAKRITKKIGDPGAEEVLSMKPDVVIVSDWTQAEKIQSMRDLGLKVVSVKSPETIQDAKEAVSQVAAAIGELEKGKQLIGMMDKKLAEIREKTSKIKPEQRKNIVLLSLMTAYGGAGCAYDDACREANVVNGIAAAGLKTGQQLTKEMLIKINPDIMLMPVYNDRGNYDTQAFIDSYLKDPSLRTVKAINDKQLIYPREQFIYNCSQDIVYCVQEIARVAYGEEFNFPDNARLTVTEEKNE